MTSLEEERDLDLGDLESAPSLAVLATAPGSRVVVAGDSLPALARALTARNCRVVAVVGDEADAQALHPLCEDVVVGRLEALAGQGPLDPGSAGAVLLMGVLAGADDPVGLLRSALSLLEPGGRLAASAANATHGAARLRLLRGELPDPSTGALDGRPARLYDRATVERLVGAADLPDASVLSVRRTREEVEAEQASDLPPQTVAVAWAGHEASTYEFLIVARRPLAEGEEGEASLLGRHRERIVALEAALAEAESSAHDLTRELAAREARVTELERTAAEAAELESILRERMAELDEAHHAVKHLQHDLMVKERYIAELRAAQTSGSRLPFRGARRRGQIASLRPSRAQRVVVHADRALRRAPVVHRLVRDAFRAVKRVAGGGTSPRA